MTNFVYDDVALPDDKIDSGGSSSVVANPTRRWSPNDANRTFQALEDIRTVLRVDGVVGDGVTNNTAALQAAITANPGRTLALPKGKYIVSSTLLIANRCTRLVGDFCNRSVDGGTEIVFTGTGPCIQIGVDNGHAWNVGDYNGPQDHLFENLWISHGAPDTALVSAGDAALRYKAGAYGIWDWRGGQVTLRNVGIEKFEANFVGVESDIDTFDVITSLYSKYGFYIGPRSDQCSIRSFYSFSCDRAITVDGARQVRIVDAQIVGCGTPTVSAIEIRRGAASINIERPWFEHLQGYQGTDQISFVSAGEVDGYGSGGSISSPGGTPTTGAIEGLAIDHPFAYTTGAGIATHTKYIVSAGKCKQLLLHHPSPPVGASLGNFDAFVAVPAAQAPTNSETQVLITGINSGTGISQCFQNLGAGAPTITIVGIGASGLIMFDNVTLGAVTGANVHAFRGSTAVVAPPGATSTLGLTGTQSNVAQAVGTVAIRGRQDGSYDTTAGALISVGLQGQSISTRSAGANGLRNVGLQGTASGAQDNRALETVDGDVYLNTSSGLTRLTTALIGSGARAAAPSSGTHVAGEVVFNADPIAGGFAGWICVTGGTPGTWKSFGAISA
jgi:pectate lyase-like protein